MRDAATAAAMSDPDLNRWFRRRWAEPAWPVPVHPAVDSVGPAEQADDHDEADLDRLGLDLLSDYRHGRCNEGARAP